MKVLCNCCGCEFEKILSQIKRTNKHYCSRSCSAKINNVTSPKRLKTKQCISCKSLITLDKKYCSDCYKNLLNIDKTLGECGYSQQAKSSTYALIRTRARAIAKKQKWNSCAKCGYNKHIEIAHIKPISDFSPSTLISEVNKISNLIPLCPNCHWEHDHKQA